jgi:hypothetical protein
LISGIEICKKNVRTAFEFSERALKLLKDYKEAFPTLFEGINKDPKQDNFDAVQIFGETHKEKLLEILKWLSGKCRNFSTFF